MSVRGSTATLPRAAHHRPPVLAADGVVVVHVSEEGEDRACYDFATLPVSAALQRSLAVLFAARISPVGQWRRIPSSSQMWYLLRAFARFVGDRDDPPSDIGQISPALWNAWRLSRPPTPLGRREITKIGALLRADPRFPAATRELTAIRPPPRPAAQEKAYSDAEFEAIKTAVTHRFRSAWRRINANQHHLQAWRGGQFSEGSTDWLLGEALEHLARTGDVPHRRRDGTKREVLERYRTALDGSMAEDTWMRLFLAPRETAALAALLVISYGWNATSILELRVPSSTPNPGLDGMITYRVELNKRRRRGPHRYETRNLTDTGPGSPGRLITQAIAATAPARQALHTMGAPTDRLLIRHVVRPLAVGDDRGLFRLGFDSSTTTGANAAPDPAMSLRRLRRTVTVLHQRTPIQHGQDVHDSVYVMPDPRTQQRSAPIIAAGIGDAVAHAHATMAARLSRDPHDGASDADSATARCEGYRRSPFAPPGAPCRASFLLCLGCPNAVITPAHLPRLAYLHQVLDGLRGVLAAAVWDHDWREHHARLDQLRRDQLTAAEWADALAAATDRDRTLIGDLLRGGYDA